MEPAIIFRAATSRVYAVVSWVVAGAVLLSFAVSGGVGAAISYGALPLLLAVVGWTAFWRPLVAVERGGVRVVNVLSTSWLPWAAITGTRTRWGLELSTHASRRTSAWAMPSRSTLGRWTSGRGEAPPPPPLHRLDSVVAGGADPRVAAEIIERHRTGHLRPADDAPPTQQRPDIVPAGLLLATAALAIVTLLL